MAIEISTLPSTPYIYQNFGSDTNNIPFTQPNNQPFSGSNNIEFYIFDLNNNILSENYNFSDYSILNEGQLPLTNVISSIYVDLEKQIEDRELLDGEYITYFNFFTPKIGSFNSNLSIKEISGDRKELEFISPLGNNEEVTNFIGEINSFDNSSFPYFYLNFGENKQIIGVNLISNENGNFIKLYQPLPEEFDINSNFWVVTPITDPIAYSVKIESEPFIIDETVKIKGPNFNLNIRDQVNNSTNNLSYQDLIQTTLTSSYDQVNNLLQAKELNVNIDYTNFSNFTHFSSAKTRLENFSYKVNLIEEYSSSLNILSNTTDTDTSSSKAIYESKINNIIKNFDGYDRFLYYGSSSFSWPKTTLTKPYQLASSDSNEVKNWLGNLNVNSPFYGGIILSASLFDEKNVNSLYYSIPEYLRSDPSNSQYELFIDMIAQHFDNIWIYYRDVSQKYNADNRLNQGISKDIVADAIKDFGIKLYQNNFSNEDLYTAFLGLTPNGNLFPFPNITGSLPTPTGFEYVNNLISASNDSIPLDDVNKSLYKRIYHNIPHLLKTKGTLPGLRALITSYGIPDTILRINEFGGKDKINVNDWDHWQREFNYAFSTTGSNFISSSWDCHDHFPPAFGGGANGINNQIMFRFKTNGLPTSNIPRSQSLWHVSGSGFGETAITLRYEGTAYDSASYSGSIKDPFCEYAYLDFYPDLVHSSSISASIYLPFFDGDWWSVAASRDDSTSKNFTLRAANKLYKGGDNNTKIGFISSSIINHSNPIDGWRRKNSISYFPASSSILTNYFPFSGSYQEIRYYAPPITESVFRDYTMNPHSIEGNTTNSSPSDLTFRASLGGELHTSSLSIHPKITGSWITTQSFSGSGEGFSNFNFNVTPTFLPNTEFIFFDQPIAGIKNTIGDKIRIENDTLPEGNTLSSFTSLSQTTNISQSYTPNINYLEVAFSPQNEINEDIINQIGFFDIGEYIGDPRQRSSSATSYPDLDNLRDDYFEKYTKNYNLKDFIRLIKFFDNSLFKMIKDFVPARTSLASGVVIKQHLLERNKYPQPQVSFENQIHTGSIDMVEISGGAAGVFNTFNGLNTSPYGISGTGPNNKYFLTQSWDENILTISGSAVKTYSNQDEFYDGIFSGSNLTVTTQSLQSPYPINNKAFSYNQVHYYGSQSAQITAFNEGLIFEDLFLNNVTSPQDGEILFFNETPTLALFRKTKYLKIAKVDCNGVDNTLVLGNVNKVFVFLPFYNTYIPYSLEIQNEQQNYYLYQLTEPSFFVPYADNQQVFPNQTLNYSISASTTHSFGLSPGGQLLPATEYDTVIGNTINYFDAFGGDYTFENTPNTPLYISASFLFSGTGALTASISRLIVENGLSSFQPITSSAISSPGSIQMSTTYYALNGDSLYLTAKGASSATFRTGSLFITQSRPISTSSCYPIIVEPYITDANFYNSDFNSLINNVDSYKLSTIFQDVDYTTNILTPSNFDLIISGSALKAPVQDSNYSSKAYTNIRYNGSKTTSRFLNTWSSRDIGTYGKLPAVESDKVYVAYGDMEGGWPPERMNASSFGIRYLIDEDGDVVIPNVSENSLQTVRGTFQTGERFRISSKTEGFGDPEWEYRKIIRSGNTIQPILYTQIGKQPGALWTSSIQLVDIQAISGSATANYQNNGSIGTINTQFQRDRLILQSSPFNDSLIGINGTATGIPTTFGYYEITSGILSENITLNFNINQLNLKFHKPNANEYVFATTFQLGVILKRNDDTIDVYQEEINTIIIFPDNVTTGQVNNISFQVPASILSVNDRISFEIVADMLPEIVPNNIAPLLSIEGGNYSITQTPLPTLPILAGNNAIWGYYDKTNYPYVITSSDAVSESLGALYGDSNAKQIDIPESGFNPITYPWSIEYGDEFRFEGNEDFSYTVGPIFGPNETVFTYPYQEITASRVSPTGSIEVHLIEIYL